MSFVDVNECILLTCVFFAVYEVKGFQFLSYEDVALKLLQLYFHCDQLGVNRDDLAILKEPEADSKVRI